MWNRRPGGFGRLSPALLNRTEICPPALIVAKICCASSWDNLALFLEAGERGASGVSLPPGGFDQFGKCCTLRAFKQPGSTKHVFRPGLETLFPYLSNTCFLNCP